MGTGFAKKKKEARMLQQKFHEMQEKMKNEQVTGISGNGLVTVVLNGEHDMLSIKIKPECVDKDDIEGLEDLIKAAYKDASKKLEDQSENLPTIPGMPSF